MASDSKLIKWFDSVIKYVDSFSIEPDAEFLQGSENCKSAKEDEARIDEPLQCSTPIPQTTDFSHPEMMDHNQIGTETIIMQENVECFSTLIEPSAYFSQPEIMDHNQVGVGKSASPRATFTTKENVSCFKERNFVPGKVDMAILSALQLYNLCKN
ncbi:hypothetical protein AVEN_89401-1 [Araneus ventricosus]|uniref:Uncharacterized protein n=1 Tax=Araneus ventricosus TaxID=182803 RepID=A0A4Y2VZ53_ARAVE|nr:hypothetical protein AVEN_89401-1 [Araneus ventricosus]